MDLQNKVAVVTGGALGIGLAYAKELLRNGVKHVVILDISPKAGEEAAEKLNAEFGDDRAFFITGDVTKPAEFEDTFTKTLQKFGSLDILINNAGIVNEKQWAKMIDININGLVHGTFLGLKYMGKDKGGVIVNIASIFGLDPVASFPVYDGTKHAVIGFSRSIAMSSEKTGVRILVMCPGITETPLLAAAIDGALPSLDVEFVVAEIEALSCQKAEAVAEGMVQIIRNASNGTVWLVEHGKPAREVLIPDRFTMTASA